MPISYIIQIETIIRFFNLKDLKMQFFKRKINLAILRTVNRKKLTC
jgi:hypothetical protein